MIKSKRAFELTEQQHKHLKKLIDTPTCLLFPMGYKMVEKYDLIAQFWQRTADELGFHWASVEPVASDNGRKFFAEPIA